MKRLWAALFGSPAPGPEPDDIKQHIEARFRELDHRSDANRSHLTQIMVRVQARRNDADVD
jgi:hypothetical protein